MEILNNIPPWTPTLSLPGVPNQQSKGQKVMSTMFLSQPYAPDPRSQQGLDHYWARISKLNLHWAIKPPGLFSFLFSFYF